MNQDVLNIQNEQSESTGQMISDRLNWDWRNPLIALPLTGLGVLLVSALVVLMQLVSA
jgi:hypothetical protein